MQRRIEKGDTVHMTWQDGMPTKAVVVHVPQGCGDSWQVEYPDGRVALVNVYASDFVGMIVRHEDDD